MLFRVSLTGFTFIALVLGEPSDFDPSASSNVRSMRSFSIEPSGGIETPMDGSVRSAKRTSSKSKQQSLSAALDAAVRSETLVEKPKKTFDTKADEDHDGEEATEDTDEPPSETQENAEAEQAWTASINAADVDVLGECMQHGSEVMDQQIKSSTTPNCMQRHIPFWQAGITYKRVKDCFQRYCLTSWLATNGLSENSNFWTQTNITSFPNEGAVAGSGLASDDILLGPLSMFKFADASAGASKQSIYRSATGVQEDATGHYTTAQTQHDMSKWSKPRPLVITLNARGLQTGWLEDVLHQAAAQTLPPSTVVYMNDGAFDATQPLLNDVRVGQVLATNPTGRHDKLSSIPLGVHHPQDWAPCLDGREAETAQRTKLLFCDGYSDTDKGQKFILNGGLNRRGKIEALKRNGFNCEFERKSGGSEYCDNMLRAKFVASPRGGGALNHREFEALASGAVPLIDANPDNSHVYDGLPVIHITDWSLVTPEFLQTEWARLQTANARGKIDRRKLYTPYWLARVTRDMTQEGD